MKTVILPVIALAITTSTPCTADVPARAFVEGGEFVMGTAKETIPDLITKYQVTWRGAFQNESEPHKVTLSSFEIDPYEVTNAQFAEFLMTNPQWQKENVHEDTHNGDYLKHWSGATGPEGRDDHPVVFITWAAAQSYCRWRGGQLPTEAQWEYVARSGDDREFPWGEPLPFPEVANYHASGHGGTVPVGSYLRQQVWCL